LPIKSAIYAGAEYSSGVYSFEEEELVGRKIGSLLYEKVLDTFQSETRKMKGEGNIKRH
jgi:hypothetical protein